MSFIDRGGDSPEQWLERHDCDLRELARASVVTAMHFHRALGIPAELDSLQNSVLDLMSMAVREAMQHSDLVETASGLFRVIARIADEDRVDVQVCLDLGSAIWWGLADHRGGANAKI